MGPASLHPGPRFRRGPPTRPRNEGSSGLMHNDSARPAKSPQGKLNKRHREALVEGSGIDPQVLAERGVRSVEKGRPGQGLPKVYSRRQKARGDGILFTVHRPNGETSTIFRPDEPDPKNPGHRY